MPWIFCEASSLWLDGLPIFRQAMMPASPEAHSFPDLSFPRLQGVPSYTTSTSSICQKTWEDPRHFSGALSLHSCLLSHVLPTNSSYLQAPTLLCLGSTSLPLVHRGPLGRKLSWFGPNLCVSLLCRNIALYFLFSDNWKWLFFSVSCSFVVT